MRYPGRGASNVARSKRRSGSSFPFGRHGKPPARSVELPGDKLLRVAVTRRERRRGLAGLAEPPADTALLLRPCRSVHTFGMRFALDLLWLDAGGRVVRQDRGVPPRRVRTCRAARAVVEAPAGQGAAFADALGAVASAA